MSIKPWVCIVMGSDSDAEVMSQAAAALDEAGVPYEMTVASAHRTPERTKEVITNAERDGAAVFIAGAGMAAHLPGAVSYTHLRAHETRHDLVCRLLLEKKKNKK